jgi:hypothetical protein
MNRGIAILAGWVSLTTACEASWQRDNGLANEHLQISEGLKHPEWSDTRGVDAFEVGCASDPGSSACTELGIALLVGAGGAHPDPKAAYGLLGEQCDRHDEAACAYRALAVERGLGTGIDLRAAVTTYESLCDERRRLEAGAAPGDGSSFDPLACFRLGALAEWKVVEASDRVIAELYAEACRFGRPDVARPACPLAAKRFRDLEASEDADPHPDVSDDAEELAARGCFIGSGESCLLLGTILGERSRQGGFIVMRAESSQ